MGILNAAMDGPKLAGQFLIASPRLLDPNFLRTVILLVQHNDDGALGLVLNRPLTVTIADILEKALERPFDIPGQLLHGGPCEGPLMAVHTYKPAAESTILPGLYFAAGKTAIETLVEESPDTQAHFFAGYAGWTPGQLERELQEDSWLLLPASLPAVFSAADQLYVRLARIASLSPHVPPHLIPDEPSMN